MQPEESATQSEILRTRSTRWKNKSRSSTISLWSSTTSIQIFVHS